MKEKPVRPISSDSFPYHPIRDCTESMISISAIVRAKVRANVKGNRGDQGVRDAVGIEIGHRE
jgi:hypothetical protein